METKSVAMRFGILGILVGALASVVPTARTDSARKAVVAEAVKPRPVNITAPNITTYHEGTKLLAAYCGEEWSRARDAKTCGGAGLSVKFFIATLADPYDSHLDYSYDADLEALRRAFETGGYVIDRYWIPGPDDTVKVGKSAARMRREIHPGVLLLRHTDAHRNAISIVYLVGETPTRGIAKEAFRNALIERRNLMGSRMLQTNNKKPCPDTALIIGPSFSGSARSLGLAISSYASKCAGPGCPAQYKVISGSATDGQVAQVLRRASPRIAFATTVNADHRLAEVSNRTIRRLYGEHARVAILRESSTQYGAALDGDSAESVTADTLLKRTLVIPFPLNITSLRAEYERNPIAQPSGSPNVAMNTPARVPLALAEPMRSRETPGATSNVTPAVLDVALRNILDELSQNEISVAGILATNVRDKLFLADLIKRHMPDIQLFTYESNLLYLHKDYNRAMRGMLVFSSYPLFMKNQEWVQRTVDGRAVAPTRVPFASDASEGIYNATLLQLGEADKLIEYGLPQWQKGARRIPVWVSTVGAQSFLPMYVYASPFPRQYASLASGPATPMPRYSVYAEMNWKLAATIALLLAAVFTVAVMYLPTLHNKIPSAPVTWGDARLLYGRVERALGQMWLDLCVFLGMVGLALLLFPFAYTLVRASERAQTAVGLVVAALLPWTVVTVVSFGRVIVAIKRNLGSAWRCLAKSASGWWRAVAILEAVGYLGLLVFGVTILMLVLLYTSEIHAMTACGISRSGPCDPVMMATFRMFYHRATAFASGVSPLAPLMVTAIALITWSLWHVHRLVSLNNATPFEAAILGEIDGRTSTGPYHEHADKTFNRLALHVATLRRYLLTLAPRRGALVLAGLLGLSVLFAVLQFQPTIEAVAFEGWLLHLSTFDILLLLSVAGALVGTSWATYRLAIIWETMRELLRHVSETPLLEAFKRAMEKFPNLEPLNPFRMAANAEMEVRSAYAWTKAARLVQGSEWMATKKLEPDIAYAISSATPLNSIWQADDANSAEKLAAVYAGHAAISEAEPDPATFGMADVAVASRMPMAIREWSRQADTFIALQGIRYVDWAQEQVRKQALSVVTALLLTTLLLSVYPFQPRGVVKVLFLVITMVSIAIMMLVITQMNRDPVLSVISRSTPGRVNWNSGYVLRIGLYAVLPVLALLSSEVGAVGDFLFSWLEPLAQFLGKL